jgi:drug/metabolite transporter (DMT)-like permease
MTRLLAIAALALPILAWGLSFPSIKLALVDFPPMTLAFGRFALAGAFLGAVHAWRGPRIRVAAADRWPLVASVLAGITVYFLCENHGLRLIPASAASLITAGIPILALLAERVWHGRRMSGTEALAAAVSFLGVALLVGVPAGGTSADPWGYVLMLGASVAWVAYLFRVRPLQARYPDLALTARQMGLGAASLLPFALAEAPGWHVPSAAGWGHLVFQGLVCSALSYLAYNAALKRLGLRVASLSINLIPVVSAIASYLWLDEVLGPWQWLGGALVLGAVVAVALRAGAAGASNG